MQEGLTSSIRTPISPSIAYRDKTSESALFLSDQFLVNLHYAFPFLIALDVHENLVFPVFFYAEDNAVVFRIVAVEEDRIRLIASLESIHKHHLMFVAVFVRYDKYGFFVVLVVAVFVMNMIAHGETPVQSIEFAYHGILTFPCLPVKRKRPSLFENGA
jgi:hypothetical protein